MSGNNVNGTIRRISFQPTVCRLPKVQKVNRLSASAFDRYRINPTVAPAMALIANPPNSKVDTWVLPPIFACRDTQKVASVAPAIAHKGTSKPPSNALALNR